MYEPIQLQVLKPAGKDIDSGIYKLILVNHSNFEKNYNELVQDSIRTNEYFDGLTGILGNTPRFQLIQSPPQYILKPKADKFQKLDDNTIIKICYDSLADAAVVLENYSITYSDPIQLSYSSDYGLYGKLVMENSSFWRIYNPKKPGIADEFLIKDTLIWDATGYNESDIVSQLPDLNEAFLQSCWYAGQKFGQQIAPYWSQKKRYLISCEQADFQTAVVYAKNNYWDKAIEIWKKYPYGKKKRLAAFAAYNLAVASETLDHIDIALEWAAKSFFLKRNDFVKNYIVILENRKKEKEEYFNKNAE